MLIAEKGNSHGGINGSPQFYVCCMYNVSTKRAGTLITDHGCNLAFFDPYPICRCLWALCWNPTFEMFVPIISNKCSSGFCSLNINIRRDIYCRAAAILIFHSVSRPQRLLWGLYDAAFFISHSVVPAVMWQLLPTAPLPSPSVFQRGRMGAEGKTVPFNPVLFLRWVNSPSLSFFSMA